MTLISGSRFRHLEMIRFWGFVVVMSAGWIVRVRVIGDHFDRNRSGLDGRLIAIAVSAVALIVPIVVYGVAYRRAAWRSWFGVPRLSSPAAWAFAAGIGVLCAGEMVQYKIANAAYVHHAIQARGLPPGVFVIGAAAAVEEIVFRGFALTEASRLYRPPVAIGLSALLFVLGHVPGWSEYHPSLRSVVLHGGSLFALGVLLAGLAHASRSLWPAIGAHTIFNVLLGGR